MKYIITESHFNHYVKVLSEQSLSDYDDEDFIEVFFEYFRPWIKENHGDDVGKYPLSYLLKKYFIDFMKTLDSEYDDDDYYYTTRQLRDAGKYLVTLRQHKLPSLLPSTKFTEKYAKQISHILKLLKLPEWLTVSFEEVDTYHVIVVLTIDVEKLLYSKETVYDEGDSLKLPYDYYNEIETFFETYMGMSKGSPLHGEIDLGYRTVLRNTEIFKNAKFGKELKQKIKSLPESYGIHSIKISINENGLMNIQLSFQRNFGWSRKDGVRDSVNELISGLGFNEDYVRVYI